MACSKPCDGFRNNLVSGLPAEKTMIKLCHQCRSWAGEDHSKFAIECKQCLDHGEYWTSFGTRAAGDYERFTTPCECAKENKQKPSF